jgi:formylglycine-generating enzyme required for sulfatase activity
MEVLHRGIVDSVQSLSSSIDRYLEEGDRYGFSSLDFFIKNLEQLRTSLEEVNPEAGALIDASLFPEGKDVTMQKISSALTEIGKRARRYTPTDRSIKEEENLFALCEEIVKEAEDEGSLEELAVFLEEEVEKGSTSPAVLFTLSAVYGRKGMKREAYELISIVEEETAKRPNVVFNLSLLHGRKSELKTELNTESVKYSPPAGFVLVRGGRFRFGEDVGYGVEGPDRSVVVGDFFMMEKKLTFEAFDSFCDATGRERLDDQGWGRGSRPAVNVTWMEAVEYCNWISGESGLEPCYTIEGENVTCDFSADGYRLPTEAEWEYAALGGMETSGFAFSGSDDPMEVGWFMDNSESSTSQVGELSPNELGLYDMSGNVWEWCWDWYDEYKGSFQLNPSGPVSGEFKILRGGSWSYFEEDMAVSSRGRAYPEDRDANNGFRLVAGIH